MSMSWSTPIQKNWRAPIRPGPKEQGAALRAALAALAKTHPPRTKHALPAQPFDRHLLALSPLYRKSRARYLRFGEFKAGLISSPRTLSSPTLLDPLIEYSPVEDELLWRATDPCERKNTEALLRIRTYVCSLFHEQNHRILWTMLPPAPRDAKALSRYLNFAESLVITMDMALGDELGALAPLFYMTGATYDPGARVKLKKREYRNYLQAALHATYLHLEFFEPREIPRAIRALYRIGDLADRAAARAGNLDENFIWKTNPAWKRKHLPAVKKTLAKTKGLTLPDHPMDNRAQYLFAEKWFEAFGL